MIRGREEGIPELEAVEGNGVKLLVDVSRMILDGKNCVVKVSLPVAEMDVGPREETGGGVVVAGS